MTSVGIISLKPTVFNTLHSSYSTTPETSLQQPMCLPCKVEGHDLRFHVQKSNQIYLRLKMTIQRLFKYCGQMEKINHVYETVPYYFYHKKPT